MAHNTDKVGFPAIPLRMGMVLKLEARSPTTDTEVGGVTSTRWSIYGSDDGGRPLTLADQEPILVVPYAGGA